MPTSVCPASGTYGLTSFTGQLPGQAYRNVDNTNQITSTTNGGRGMQLAAHLEF